MITESELGALSDRKLLLWFEKGCSTKMLNLAQREVVEAIDTVAELENALTRFYNGEAEETKTAIDKIFSLEEEIDGLRRRVSEEPDAETTVGCREELVKLVEHMDRAGDHVKDSARSVRVLMETTVPREILNEYLRLAKSLKGCAVALGECIEMLGVDSRKATEAVQRVEAFEEEADEQYVAVRTMLIRSELDAAVISELMDLLDHIERAADTCTDTAESMRTLAARGIRGRW